MAICGISGFAFADKNTLRSHIPDVKNGWLVKDDINPAFTPATTVVDGGRLLIE